MGLRISCEIHLGKGSLAWATWQPFLLVCGALLTRYRQPAAADPAMPRTRRLSLIRAAPFDSGRIMPRPAGFLEDRWPVGPAWILAALALLPDIFDARRACCSRPP
jgi:hypothetical protein